MGRCWSKLGDREVLEQAGGHREVLEDKGEVLEQAGGQWEEAYLAFITASSAQVAHELHICDLCGPAHGKGCRGMRLACAQIKKHL